jgi:hypothetical protein
MNDVLSSLHYLLGDRAVFIPLALGTKIPTLEGWQKLTFAESQCDNHQRALAEAIAKQGNIGVVLGGPSGGLCSIDIDVDSMVEPFLTDNPGLRETLISRGARGVQIFFRPTGDYPRAIQKMAFGDGRQFGEWRADGGQSVIYGKHPSGCRYSIENDTPAIAFPFADVVWTTGLDLPWLESQAKPNSETEEQEPAGDRILRQEATNQTERLFPKLSGDAFYGMLGDITKHIEPITEADPAAVLVQLMVSFGNIVGRTPFYPVEAEEHHANLFACLVGRSAKGRKGTSLNHTLQLFKAVDPEWSADHVASGLSSGEGLIWAVRDPIFKPERNKKTGQVDEVKVDDGINDKRLLVAETEFAQGLKTMSRPANILSTVIRSAWDRGNIRTLTKNDPARATNAHISVVAHITEEELKRELSQCELFNGFANRFLWVAVQRSKLLPDGGRLRPEIFEVIVRELQKAIQVAQRISKMERSEEARGLWHEIYTDLSREAAGLTGMVANRAEAQTLRLSMVYALADGSSTINEDHLHAALALWQYCRDSARYLFGDRLANPNAQRIADALRARPGGMTRSEISIEVFQKNISKDVLELALTTLESLGFAYREKVQTTKRDAERWFYEYGVRK